MTNSDNTSLIKLTNYSRFDIQNKRLFAYCNQGFFWNCSATLLDIIEIYNKYNMLPTSIDFSCGFRPYRSDSLDDADLYPLFFSTKTNPNIKLKKNLTSSVKHHDVYALINFNSYKSLIDNYFRLSEQIYTIYNMLIEKYNFNPSKAITVWYRGTDKSTEVKLADPKHYLSEAKKLLSKHPDHTVIIQTDDLDVRNLFTSSLGEKCFFFPEMPVSSGKIPTFKLSEKEMKMTKTYSAQLLLAVTNLLSKSNYIITYTGNLALWLCLFRGNNKNILQFDKNGKLISGLPSALHRHSYFFMRHIYYKIKYKHKNMIFSL